MKKIIICVITITLAANVKAQLTHTGDTASMPTISQVFTNVPDSSLNIISALNVSSLERGDSTIMTSRESFIWFSRITSREEYDLWTNQFHFNKAATPGGKFIEVRVNDKGKIHYYTFKEFGDLIFPRNQIK